ncbi:MAG TPA: hypothetical protein VGB95_06560 [Chitinophagales bacterium]
MKKVILSIVAIAMVAGAFALANQKNACCKKGAACCKAGSVCCTK